MAATQQSELRRAQATGAVAQKASRFTNRVESAQERLDRQRREADIAALQKRQAKEQGAPNGLGLAARTWSRVT